MNFGEPTKLHYAKQLAAALGSSGLVNLDRVVIEAFNIQTHAHDAPMPEPQSLWRC